MRKILFVCDFAVHTGFSTVSQNIADNLKDWDIHILAINYYGDYNEYQRKYKLYNPSLGGDVYGYNRIVSIVNTIEPDVIFIINDAWVLKPYIEVLKDSKVPIVTYSPIDAIHVPRTFAQPLNKVAAVITYTEFAKRELSKAGVKNNIHVIPHGVDTSIFYPMDKSEARNKLGLSDDMYIVNITDRNGGRKRIDLGFYIFSQWAKDKPETVKLYYHGAIRDMGYDILDLVELFGLQKRILLTDPNISAAKGIPIEDMRMIYSAADVGCSFAIGEGWGLTVMERQACKVPMILPFHSALAEWPINTAEYVSCNDIYVNTGGINTVGMIPNKDEYIKALEHVYEYPDYRNILADKGYNNVTSDKYKWNNIAKQFEDIFLEVIEMEKDNGQE